MGGSVTASDEGIEFPLGQEVIDEVEMIHGDIHGTNGTGELSFFGKPFIFVFNIALDKFPGGFNAEVICKIIAKPSAEDSVVIQILTFFEDIETGERTHLNASCLYLGTSRQG